MTERRLEEVEFCSEGAALRGRLFRPASRRPAPAVAMAHGFSATAHEAFEALGGPKGLHEIEGGHFGLLHWPGKNFDHACAVQTGFLRRMLLVDRA